jgi:hypothetical protein
MNKAKAREIQDRIRQVLLHDWDPIGVADEPQAQDEYDSYVGAIYRLLASRASEQEIADHLGKIETEGMELPPREPSILLGVVRKLKAVDFHLADRGPAA